jgi:DNA-binding transcriptional regulator of glucitol operon
VLLSPRWLALHVLAIALVAACLGLGWWQWQRVGEGSARSLGYALEWPFFAAFVVLIWGHLVRDALRPGGTERPDGRSGEAGESSLLPSDPARAVEAPPEEEPDEELAAYNRYLAELHAREAQRNRP